MLLSNSFYEMIKGKRKKLNNLIRPMDLMYSSIYATKIYNHRIHSTKLHSLQSVAGYQKYVVAGKKHFLLLLYFSFLARNICKLTTSR